MPTNKLTDKAVSNAETSHKKLLTDKAIANAELRRKPYRILDIKEAGLCLRVSPSGVKSWQFRYKLSGARYTATLGKYPAVPLIKARKKAQEARELAADGKQVTAARNVARAMAAVAGGNTFKVVAAAWVQDEARRRAWSQDHK